MNLIDADKLMESLDPKSVWVGLVLSELIDNAPTVEAIPKEWVRDYMLKLPDGSAAYECILVMLEDWEKCVSAERFAEWEKENEQVSSKKIREDDKNFPHCPLHHEGYCHLPQTHYQKGNALYMTECLGTINKRPPWFPLKEEKEAIPIEFIEEQIEITTDINSDELDVLYAVNLSYLLKLWEIKNGK